jgi:hypothetical protein
MSVIPTLEAEILDYYFDGASTVPRIGNLGSQYLGLASASPGESGTTANELTNLGGTQRKFLNPGDWNAASNGSISYSLEISWSPTGSGAATHFFLSTNPTWDTTHDFYDSLVATCNYQAADPLRIRADNLIVTVTGLFGLDSSSGWLIADNLLENLLRGASIGDRTSGYFGLSTTTPNVDGSNITEPSVGAYARTSQKTFSSIFNNPTGSSPTTITTNQAVIWPEATASWGTPTHWVIFSASTGGGMYYYGEIDNPTEVTNGLQPRFDTGDLVLSCD